MKVAVFIGRMSPPHFGHINTIQYGLDNFDYTIVILGSAKQAPRVSNPFSVEERADMLYNLFPAEDRLKITSVCDEPSDAEWILSVQQTVDEILAPMIIDKSPEVTIIGTDKDMTTYYLHSFPQWKKLLLPKFGDVEINSTTIREIIFTFKIKSMFSDISLYQLLKPYCPLTIISYLQKHLDSGKLNNVIKDYEYCVDYQKPYDKLQFPVQFICADGVVIQSGHVLVIERANHPGFGLYAIPGGHVNFNERIRVAAVREVMEETGILFTTGKKAEEITRAMLNGSIIAERNFDNPKRSDKGRVLTTAFVMHLDDSKPLPKVGAQLVPEYESGGVKKLETADAFWMPLKDVNANRHKFFDDHYLIIKWAISCIGAI